MIISKTPYRISLLGGGTDYPSWYNLHGGQVLSFTIDKYVYISVRQLPNFFDHKLRLVYSKIENVKNINQLTHPSAKEILNYYNIQAGLEIHYDGDLPAHSGLGSSSAFSVGLINALSKVMKIKYSKKELASKAIYIEQDLVKDIVGSQDQINAAYGGFNHIKFLKNKKFKVNKINLNKLELNKFEKNFMLFFTGITRYSSEITKTYANQLNNYSSNLSIISNLVSEGIAILRKKNFDQFGELLDYYWLQKKKLSTKITNLEIDKLYTTAIEAGALGGKITGAGGGGFLLFYVPLKKQNDVKNALKNLLHIPFNLDYSGSKIIFNNSSKINFNE